jgi:CRP-like cAMP-binding protein
MRDALSLLSELTDADITWLLNTAQEQQFLSNAVVIEEGSHPENLYIVLSGLVGVHVASAGTRELARLGPGELLGEMSFLDGTAASATIAAVEHTLLLVIPRPALEAKLQSDTSFASRLYKSFALIASRRLRERVGALGRLLQEKIEYQSAANDRWQRLSSAIDEFKLLMQKADREAMQNGDRVPEPLAREVRAKIIHLLLFLNDEIGEQAPESAYVKEEMGARVQRELLPYLLQTTTAERMYSKPRGYAGDYLTIDWMYRNQPAGTGRVGWLLDSAVLDLPAAQAVRNRVGLLTAAIMNVTSKAETPPVRITSLASGPAREIFDVLDRLDDPHRLAATLVDIDLQALAYVSDQLEKRKLRRHMSLLHGNLVYLATGRQFFDISNQDMVYSIGLIDYFDDKFVVLLLDYIFGILKPGGKVILGNVHTSNPTRAFMDYVLEWKLIHRTEEDMNRLFASSRFARPCTAIRFEETGTNMFAECTKE